MSFEWADYLELAKNLSASPASPGPEEAALRTATSRAYYAALHLASQRAQAEGYIPTYSGDDHQGVSRHFRTSSADRVRKKIATDLDRMRKSRNQADYDLALTQTPRAMADLTIKSAEQTISALASLE